METTNPTGKSLDELIKDAKHLNLQMVVIGAGESGTSVSRVIDSEHLIGVHIVNLLEDDQKTIKELIDKRKPLVIDDLEDFTQKLVENILRDAERRNSELVDFSHIQSEEKANAKKHSLPKSFKLNKGFKLNLKQQFKGLRKH